MSHAAAPCRLLRRAVAIVAVTVAIAAALAVGAPSASAGQYGGFGMTPRDVAMGSAMTGAASGWSGLFYNPGNLIDRGARVGAPGASATQRLGLQLTLTAPALFVEQDKADARSPITPDTHVGFGAGWVKPLGGVFDERLAFAFAVYVPTKTLYAIQGLDPQTPHFAHYQNVSNKTLINFALAWQPLDWFSLGAGVQIMANLGGAVNLDMDIANGTFTKRELAVSVLPTASPVIGATFRPVDGMKVGLSYRGSSGLSFEIPMRITEGRALSLDILVRQTVLWSPHEISLGLAYAFEDTPLTVAVDATFGLWSQAPDPSPQLTVDVGGALLDAFGLAQGIDVNTRSEPLELQYANTLTPRVGVEWSALDWLTLRGGYFYRPSPAPVQTAATTYLDNHAHVLSAGVGFAVADPTQGGPAALLIDLALQSTILKTRSVVRRAALDPVGSLRHGGVIWGLSLSVSHQF